MVDAKTYHKELHEQIWTSTRLADWIYHDVRLDCDGESGERSAERIEIVKQQHGLKAVFGICGAWATKAIYRVEDTLRAAGEEPPSWQAMLINGDAINPAELDISGRAYISALQFVTAIGNDDVEMADAIFHAAADSEEEDLQALIVTILKMSINLSNQAKREGP